MRWSSVIGLVLVMLAACGDGDVVEGDMAPPDADTPDGPSLECWPGDGTLLKGSLTLGTGTDTFVPMPDELQLQHGASGGYSVIVNARMTGLAPGNVENLFDPDNPRTRIRGFFADDNVPISRYSMCPFRLGYRVVGDAYQLAEPVSIIFETCWHSDQLFNRPIRIEATIMDASGGYAHAANTVVLLPPTWIDPMDAGIPGCDM